MSYDPLANLYKINKNEKDHRAKVIEFLNVRGILSGNSWSGPFWYLTVMMRANQNDGYTRAQIIRFMRESGNFTRRHFNNMSVDEAVSVYFECVDFIIHGGQNDIQWWLKNPNGR